MQMNDRSAHADRYSCKNMMSKIMPIIILVMIITRGFTLGWITNHINGRPYKCSRLIELSIVVLFVSFVLLYMIGDTEALFRYPEVIEITTVSIGIIISTYLFCSRFSK